MHMSQIKNAQIRYRVIDRCLRNTYKPYPSKEQLRIACEEALFGSEDGANICHSTIEKDLFAMRMENDAPIQYSRLHRGYFYEDPNFSINDIPLSEDDIESIKFASNTLMQFRDSSMFKQFGQAIDKIFDRITISQDPNALDLQNLVHFEVAISTKGNEYLAPILSAIRAKQIIRFDYASFINGKIKKREVLPLLLKEYRNRWYLISYDLSKNTIITYALERLTEFETTENYHFSEIEFNAESFFKNAVGITANQDSIVENVVIKADNIAAKYIQSQPFHESQVMEKEGKNRTQFSMQVIVSEELIRNILSYSHEIEVLKPISLRAIIMERTEKVLANYRS